MEQRGGADPPRRELDLRRATGQNDPLVKSDRGCHLETEQQETGKPKAGMASFLGVWSAGFTFLFVVALIAIPVLLSGAAAAWIFTILMGWHGDVGFLLSMVFSLPFAPYIYGLALPHLRRFTKEKSSQAK